MRDFEKALPARLPKMRPEEAAHLINAFEKGVNRGPFVDISGTTLKSLKWPGEKPTLTDSIDTGIMGAAAGATAASVAGIGLTIAGMVTPGVGVASVLIVLTAPLFGDMARRNEPQFQPKTFWASAGVTVAGLALAFSTAVNQAPAAPKAAIQEPISSTLVLDAASHPLPRIALMGKNGARNPKGYSGGILGTHT